VKFAVMVDVPAPVKVSVDPLTVATAVFDEVYANVPGVLEVGAVIVVALSPKVAETLLNGPSVGVA
jgi:hypothetical protein